MKGKPALLLEIFRGDIPEVCHHGYIFSIDKNGNSLLSKGEYDRDPFYLRSCEKPFQAMALKTTDTISKFNLNPKELAVISASHSGTKEHLEVVQNILKKIGLDESYLKCPPTEPIDVQERNELLRKRINFSSLHNNCSGKHAGMLAVCVKEGWDVSDYMDIAHPLQQEIEKIVTEYCELSSPLIKSKDGCGTPTTAMTIDKMIIGYQRLFSDFPELKEAFVSYPCIVGGAGRIESEMMLLSEGKIIAKSGAEGLFVALNLENDEILAVKILDGNKKARDLVFLDTVKKLNWLNSEEINSLESKFPKKIKNSSGETIIKHISNI